MNFFSSFSKEIRGVLIQAEVSQSWKINNGKTAVDKQIYFAILEYEKLMASKADSQ